MAVQATSSLKFYKINFPTDTNVYLDDLESYLTSIDASALKVNNFQYIKHALALTIKLDVAAYTQSIMYNFEYNYLRVKNTSDDDPFYYYVQAVEWISTAAIRLTLRMDTVNTLGQGAKYGNPRNFNDKTAIMRQHGDRFVKNSESGGYIKRKVDEESEGIAAEKQMTQQSQIIMPYTDGGSENFNWYLIYKTNVETDTTIDCFLCADNNYLNPIVLSSGSTTPTTYTYSSFVNDQVYLFTYEDNGNGKFKVDSGTEQTLNVTTYNKAHACQWSSASQPAYAKKVESSKLNGFCLYRHGTQLYISYLFDAATLYCSATGGVYTVYNSVWSPRIANDTDGSTIISTYTPYPYFATCTSVTINAGGFFRTGAYTDAAPLIAQSTNHWSNLPNFLGTVSIAVGINYYQLSNIDTLNRVDPRLIKIIKLPYCPINYQTTQVGGQKRYTFIDTSWQLDGGTGFLKYNGVGLPTMLNNSGRISTTLDDLRCAIAASRATNDAPEVSYESKLFHSDFYSKSFVYDSFSTEIRFESIQPSTSLNINLPIRFKTTSTINSRFGFYFDLSNIGTYKPSANYEQYMLVSRNNEELLLNNEYVNYQNTTKKYDETANKLALNRAAWNIAGSVFGNVGSIGSSAYSGYLQNQINKRSAAVSALASYNLGNEQGALSSFNDYYLRRAGLIGGIASQAIGAVGNIVVSTANYFNLKESQEVSMQAKQAELASRTTTVAGSDDVDLMSWYCGNRLSTYTYEIKDYLKKKLYTIFFKIGYAHTAIEQPDVTSRYWWNFIQCDPGIDYTNTNIYEQAWIDDLAEHYKAGVTVFHNHSNNYCLAQNYENYETWLLS